MCPTGGQRVPSPSQPPHTNLDGEAGREAQGDEVAQFGEERIADGHQVDDGGHLLTEGQRVVLAQPQLRLEPVGGGTGARMGAPGAPRWQHGVVGVPSSPLAPLTSASWW